MSKLNHAAYVFRIMQQNDPEGALQELLKATESFRPKRIVAAFQNIRTKILRNESYKRSDVNDRIAELRSTLVLSKEDDDKLQQLMTSPLRRLKWVQSIGKPYFESSELTKLYRKLKLVCDPYDDFILPEEYYIRAEEDKKKLIVENHKHKTHDTTFYHYDTQEIDDMITTAEEWCVSDKDWSIRANSLRLLESLALLTGRRKYELCKTLKIRSVPNNEFQAEVCGLSKRLISDDSQWQCIPLLAPLSVVVSGLTRLRRFSHKPGQYNGYKKLFPKLTHTRYRDIYCKRAYESRSINQFLPDSCSELYWKSKALCDNMTTFSLHYTTVVIDNENGEPKPEPKRLRFSLPESTEMASEVGGSSHHHLPHTL